MPPGCRFTLASGLVVVVLFLSTFSSSAQIACSAPIADTPHQGGGESAGTIYGVQADISNSNPVFGCAQNWDSFTDEWVMVVGPDFPAQPEWIQLGWERDPNYMTVVHFWYQYIGPANLSPIEGHFDPTIYPIARVRTYKIEAVSDPDPTVGTIWMLWADNILLDTIPAANLGWSGGSQYGTNMQWSGEVSYVESDMGGPYYNAAQIVWPMWTLGGGYIDVTTPYFFNSSHPRYAGDARQFSDGTWFFRNWSWYRVFLPFIDK